MDKGKIALGVLSLVLVGLAMGYVVATGFVMFRYGEGFSTRAVVQHFLAVLRRPALEILPRWKPRWPGAVYGESALRFPAPVQRGVRFEGCRPFPMAP